MEKMGRMDYSIDDTRYIRIHPRVSYMVNTRSALIDLLSGFYDFDTLLKKVRDCRADKKRAESIGDGINIQDSIALKKFLEQSFVETHKLIVALAHLPDVDSIMEEAEGKRLILEEKYKELRPVGLGNASFYAKSRREMLRDNDDEAQMSYLQSILEYIDDRTVKLLKINEIFKVDYSSLGRHPARQEGDRKGYHFLSDYQPPRRLMDPNAGKNQSHACEEETDWYRFKNTFGDYVGSLPAMVGMTEQRAPYWTKSISYDSTRDEPRAIVRFSDDLSRGTRVIQDFNGDYCCYGCGFMYK